MDLSVLTNLHLGFNRDILASRVLHDPLWSSLVDHPRRESGRSIPLGVKCLFRQLPVSPFSEEDCE